MSLRVRATRISAITEQGRFGYEGVFGDGLSFIRAENNMGKTTTLMAILYALGWEGMLGPGREVPLTPAVTSEIADSSGQRLPVLESSVMVELEGAGGDTLTLRRPIVSDSERRELVHSWDGPALTVPSGDYESRDYYVRLPGAAQREAGLHHRLAQFVGWELPEVTTWDGGSVPLYTEILAPFLFVEQTRGWAWIASVMPRYLRVRDPERRAIEFLLSLESLTRAASETCSSRSETSCAATGAAQWTRFAAASTRSAVCWKMLPETRRPTGHRLFCRQSVCCTMSNGAQLRPC
jgi:hypothetical protein